MALLTGEQARERGRQIVLANPAGIRIADISGQILRENPDMHEAGDTSKPSGTIRGATWDLDKKFPGEITKTEDRRFVPIRAKGKPERKKAEPRAAVNVPVQGNQTLTGTEAGLSGDDQIRIALECMIRHGGTATTPQLYEALEAKLDGRHLSVQGKASLRFFVNTIAVQAGYVYPYDKNNPGWRIKRRGRQALQTELAAPPTTETVVDINTGQQGTALNSAARGAAFELYVLRFLKKVHPRYTWFHQGKHKQKERGLDFIGDRVGDEPRKIGVQAKCHASNNAPTSAEWEKFLAGCFLRGVDEGLFITTGRLTSEQRQDRDQARVTVIEGDELDRLAKERGMNPFTGDDDPNRSSRHT
jgi:Restriction endonuclease